MTQRNSLNNNVQIWKVLSLMSYHFLFDAGIDVQSVSETETVLD